MQFQLESSTMGLALCKGKSDKVKKKDIMVLYIYMLRSRRKVDHAATSSDFRTATRVIIQHCDFWIAARTKNIVSSNASAASAKVWKVA